MTVPLGWRLAGAVYLVAELALLVLFVRWFGGWVTFALMVGTSLLGGWLIRSEGLRAFGAVGAALREGRVPDREVADTRVVLAGGLLLVLPGFLTDVAGLVMLAPPFRSAGRRLLRGRPALRPGTGGWPGQPGTGTGTGTGQVIRGEVVDAGDD